MAWKIKSCGKAHSGCGRCSPDRFVRSGLSRRGHTLTTEHRSRLSEAQSKRHTNDPDHLPAIARLGARAAWRDPEKMRAGQRRGHRAGTRSYEKLAAEKRAHYANNAGTCRCGVCNPTRTRVSKVQVRFGLVLLNAGYDVYCEVPCGPYSLDWWDPERRIAWEVDGAYWHTDHAKERTRDEYLRSRGITVVHVDTKEVPRVVGY